MAFRGNFGGELASGWRHVGTSWEGGKVLKKCWALADDCKVVVLLMTVVGKLIFCVLDRVALTSLRRVFVSSRCDAVGEIAKKRAFYPCDSREGSFISLRGIVQTWKWILRA
jgi:hypothetical protein